MSLQAWPESVLPLPTLDHESQPLGASLRTDINYGLQKQRGRFSQANDVRNASWQLSGSEYQIFVAFLYWKLDLGYAPFTMPCPIEGDGTISYICKFVDGVYNAKFNEGRWGVIAQLEIQVPALADA